MSDTAPLRMRCESSGARHASLIYNFFVVWLVWKNLCFLVWLFAISVMSSLRRYLFVGITLMTWPMTWPVDIDHCSVSNLAKYAADFCHYLDTNLRAEKCVPATDIGLKTSRIKSTLVSEGRNIKCVPVIYTLQRIRHLCRLSLHADFRGAISASYISFVSCALSCIIL